MFSYQQFLADMDPLSISAVAISTSKVAWKVGSALLELHQTSQVVNETLRGLQNGVKQVEDICRLIDNQINLLRRVTTDNADKENADNDDLFDGIEAQMSSCATAIHKVNSNIQRVAQSRIGSLHNAVRQIRLNMNQKDIDDSRNQIQAGVQNLQLSLQLVTLKATYLAPRVANETLLQSIREIQSSVNKPTVDRRLHEFADSYIERGTTLYAKSVAGSVVDGNFRYSTRPEAIADWLGQLEALRIDAPTSPSSNNEDDIFSFSGQSYHTELSPLASEASRRPSTSMLSTVMADDDDNEFAIEQIQSAQASGREAYHTRNYKQAEDMLSECLALIRSLPEHQRKVYDLDEMHLLLALSAFHLHDPETAKEALNTALERPSEAHTELKFRAGSSLAEVYIRLGQYDLALLTADNVYKGRRRSLGATNELCYESLALLAHIYQLQNQSARAQNLRSMIPKDQQIKAYEKYKDLLMDHTIDVVLKDDTPVESSPPVQVVASQPATEEWSFKSAMYPISLAVSPDGINLACGMFKDYSEKDSRIEIRDIQLGTLIRELVIKNGSVANCLAFDSQGQRLASGHRGLWRRNRWGGESVLPLMICIWDVQKGTLLSKFCKMSDQTNLATSTLAFTPQDDQLILTYQYDGRPPFKQGKFKPGFMTIDCESGAVVHQDDCGSCYIQGFSRDGQRFALRQEDSVIVRSLQKTSTILETIPHIGVSAKYAPDGSLIGIAAQGKINVYKNGRMSTQALLPEPSKQTAATTTTSIKELQPKECKFAFLRSGIMVAAIKPLTSRCLYLVAPQLGLCKEFAVAKDRPGVLVGAFMLTPDAKWLLFAEHVSYVRNGVLRVFDVSRLLERERDRDSAVRRAATF